MEELAPGDVVERYTVEAKLGEGGMAAVYRVRHGTLGTLHALKVLTVGGKKIRKRLVHEGRVQAMIYHPNVVAVRDVLDVDGAPGLLMDYIDGPDLEAWIDEHRPDPALATEVFRQVVRAVQAAHRHGVVHRDLKPANVLMRRRPNGAWQPKVADFGLAKALAGEGEPGLGMTRQGAAMGTPSFMAPEQIRDASSVDHRADLWALGCIYYQLLTGELAFPGDDIVDIYNAVTEARYAPLSDRLPHLPPEIERTIALCLQVDPDRRLKSCASVLAVLEGDDPDSEARTWEGVELRSDVPPSPTPTAEVFEQPLEPPPSQVPAAPREREPAGRAPAPGGVGRWAWLAPLVGAVVIGGGSLLGVLGLVWVATHAWEQAPFSCSGWVRGPTIFLKSKGAVWTLPGDRDVVRALPSEDNGWKAGEPNCALPAGTAITLVEEPVRLGRAGIWIRVLPSNTETPEPEEEEPDEPPPEEEEPAE